jgi:hypothetical protein|nr:MAG TPA: hypothetical protein [Caudoviricetes sp.]
MKVNALYAIKSIVIFLILFYVDAQLLDKLFNSKSVSDILVFLVSLVFMLAILTVHAHLMYTKLISIKKDVQND